MIYVISEANNLELPVATAGSLNELAKMCQTEVSTVYKIIKNNRKTKLFNGKSVKIYKIMER